jgi:hypothetical protein
MTAFATLSCTLITWPAPHGSIPRAAAWRLWLLAPLWVPVAVRLAGVRKTREQHRLRAFGGAAFRVLSPVVLASAPSRNNPVMGGVLLTGAAGEMPAGWTCGQSRRSRLRSRWRRYRGSWAMAR